MPEISPKTILTELLDFDFHSSEITFKRPSITLDSVATDEISYIVPLMKFVCREEPTEKLYQVLDDYLDWKKKPMGEAEKNIKFVTVVGTSGKGKTTFARRFIDLPYTGKHSDIVADCKDSNRRYRVSCTSFDITRDPETQLSLMILFEAFKYSMTTGDLHDFLSNFHRNYSAKLSLENVLELITNTFCSRAILPFAQRLVIINLDETNALLNNDKRKDFIQELLLIIRNAARRFTVLTILSGTHSVALFEQVKISQCKFVDIELKLITLDGAKEILCGMVESDCEISPYLEYLLTLCGGVGRYLEISIIQMSKIGAFRKDGTIIKGFRADSYDYFLHKLQNDEIHNLLRKVTAGVLEHYPKVFRRYSTFIELLSCYTLFQWPVTRGSQIMETSIGDLEKDGFLFLQPIDDMSDMYFCVVPFITLHWAIYNSIPNVQLPFLNDLTGYFSSDESENNSLHIMMAKLWGLFHKNNLFPDSRGLCKVMLSEILPLRQEQEDIEVMFRPVFSIKSAEQRIEMQNYGKFNNVPKCIAFLNAKGASFPDSIIFSAPMIGIQEKQSIIAKKRSIIGNSAKIINDELFQKERAKFPSGEIFVLIADATSGDVKFGDRDIFIDTESFASFAGPLMALRKLHSLNQLNTPFKRMKLSK